MARPKGWVKDPHKNLGNKITPQDIDLKVLRILQKKEAKGREVVSKGKPHQVKVNNPPQND